MRCPVCRAENDEPTCRRCRADLGPLFALERQRAEALAQAAGAAVQGQGAEVVYYAESAHRLRGGADTLRWLALGHLLERDFPRALAFHRRLRHSATD
jgi:hypothetical protein